MIKVLSFIGIALIAAGNCLAQSGSVTLNQRITNNGTERAVTIKATPGKAIGFNQQGKLDAILARGTAGVDYIAVTGTPSAGMLPLATSGTTAVWTMVIAGSTPASATATCTPPAIAYDASYIYVCTGTNTWKRAAIATWP